MSGRGFVRRSGHRKGLTHYSRRLSTGRRVEIALLTALSTSEDPANHRPHIDHWNPEGIDRRRCVDSQLVPRTETIPIRLGDAVFRCRHRQPLMFSPCFSSACADQSRAISYRSSRTFFTEFPPIARRGLIIRGPLEHRPINTLQASTVLRRHLPHKGAELHRSNMEREQQASKSISR